MRANSHNGFSCKSTGSAFETVGVENHACERYRSHAKFVFVVGVKTAFHQDKSLLATGKPSVLLVPSNASSSGM